MKDDRLNLYKSLFKGRQDVFALRWEKGAKSSYMPAYIITNNLQSIT